ncbi:MAG: nucleoside deaminase [Pseudomonadota bacterium]|nr:nucleoside deaminase [Pseudomonadota bacterium]
MNEKIFKKAYGMAVRAFKADEVPVGAVIFKTKTGEMVACGRNQTEAQKSPLAHAEMICIQKALKKTGEKRLVGYSLFVTLEPCAMCAGAIAGVRLDNLYFGAYDPKSGAIKQGAKVFDHPQTHHKIYIQGGIHETECAQILKDFFKEKRKA